jgi:hypothetical protein
VSKVDLRLQCGMPCSKLEVSTVQHGTLSGAGYLHQSRFPIEEQREPVGVRQILRLIRDRHVGEGLGHSVEAERVKLVEGWMLEQVLVS